MSVVFVMVFYTDRYKILCDLPISNKNPRSFLGNGVMIASPYFPPARLYVMEHIQLLFIFSVSLSRLSFEIYNKKNNVDLFLLGSCL